MTHEEDAGTSGEREPAPDESPFELVPIEGIPFDDDSEEAHAIERVLRWTDRDGATVENAP